MPQNPFQAALENLRKVGQGVYRPRPDTALLSANELAPRRPLTDLTGEPGGSPVEQDPSSTDYLYKTRLADETKDRLFNATRAGDPNEAAALKGLLGTTEQDIADSPITQQRAQGEDYLAKQRAARTVGFDSSQEQGQFGQKLEMAKATAPVDVEKLRGMFGVQQEQERGKWQVEAAKQREAGYVGRTTSQMLKNANDNSTKLQIAKMNAGDRVGAAAIGRIITERSRIQEGIDRGTYTTDDPNIAAHLKSLDEEESRHTGANTQPNTAVTTPEAHVRDLMSKHPGLSRQQYIELVSDPSGEEYLDRPEDQNRFVQALGAAGVR
jgi:hypothetical protein